jgi:hypothetical protein
VWSGLLMLRQESKPLQPEQESSTEPKTAVITHKLLSNSQAY